MAGLMAQRDAVAAGKGWWRLENCHGNGEPFSDPRKKSIVCRVREENPKETTAILKLLALNSSSFEISKKFPKEVCKSLSFFLQT